MSTRVSTSYATFGAVKARKQENVEHVAQTNDTLTTSKEMNTASVEYGVNATHECTSAKKHE